jgi:aspartyl-tRNA(Asn)/glutamyl-tRNA(Gln) amidotransferase subunit A
MLKGDLSMGFKPDPSKLTIASACQQMREGAFSIEDLTKACLARIDELNPELNAFITPTPEEAKKNSKEQYAIGLRERPLYGIPIAVKDLYETKGIRTTAGTPFFKDNIPQEDCVVVRKLKDGGATIVGKTNTHEIALGVTGINPHFGNCRNPWDTRRISGGSSSGSAVAVATVMCLGAVGTDTGGSIRIPASLCGVVGLKPTYGRVSLRGIIPLSWNLDHAGPLTRSVMDAALMLGVMAGYDELDPGSAQIPVDFFAQALPTSLRGWNIAIATGDYVEESDPAVISALSASVKVFESLGASLTRVNTDFLRELALANGKMVQADAAAFHRERLQQHPEWFGADIRERLENGRALTSTDYSLARRTQQQGRRTMEVFFKSYDLLLLPTTPITAPLIEGTDAIEQARRLTRFTSPFNLTGLPAMSIPCGFDSDQLPIGLQLVAKTWDEARLIQAGQLYENATEWHHLFPSVSAH